MTALTSGDQAVLVMACKKIREVQYLCTDASAIEIALWPDTLSEISDKLRDQLNAIDSVLRSNGIMP